MGLSPVTPQKAAGWRMDPPVSDPSASGAIRAETAAADPPEDPPGARAASQGLRVGPPAAVSVVEPMANSSMFVCPSSTRPAARRRSTAAAS